MSERDDHVKELERIKRKLYELVTAEKPLGFREERALYGAATLIEFAIGEATDV